MCTSSSGVFVHAPTSKPVSTPNARPSASPSTAPALPKTLSDPQRRSSDARGAPGALQVTSSNLRRFHVQRCVEQVDHHAPDEAAHSNDIGKKPPPVVRRSTTPRTHVGLPHPIFGPLLLRLAPFVHLVRRQPARGVARTRSPTSRGTALASPLQLHLRRRASTL